MHFLHTMAYLLCRTISFSIKANYLLGLERARGDVCISLWEKMQIGFPFPSNLCPRVLGFRKYWIGTWVQHSNRLLDPHSVLTTLPIWTHSICLHVVSIPPPFCHVANASASTQPVQHSYRWIKNSPFEHLTLNLCPHIWHFKHDPSKPGFCSHFHPDHLSYITIYPTAYHYWFWSRFYNILPLLHHIGLSRLLPFEVIL